LRLQSICGNYGVYDWTFLTEDPAIGVYVPEPISVGLFLAGGVWVTGCRRRR
jgi:hypothetical protein